MKVDVNDDGGRENKPEIVLSPNRRLWKKAHRTVFGLSRRFSGAKNRQIDKFCKFVPYLVQQVLAKDHNRFLSSPDGPSPKPDVDKYEAVSVFFDISGYTKFAEKLVQNNGFRGAELLNSYVSEYFKQLISSILNGGGDVIKFAGDAMLCTWIVRDEDTSLPDLALSVTALAMSLVKEFKDYHPTDWAVFQLHVGIGVGQLSAFYVGGVDDSWEFFVAGDPVLQMCSACEDAISGQVVVSPETWVLVKDKCTGTEKQSGNVLVEGVRVSVEQPCEWAFTIHTDASDALRCFVLKIVQARQDTGQSEVYFSEYRQCVILMVKLPELNYDAPDILAVVQKAVVAVQKRTNKFGGVVSRVLQDDKGTRFKIAFGMPGMSHEDDAVRAVTAALDLHAALTAQNLQPDIGVASGPVYCGITGSDRRCEYTSVGANVIRAARLMQRANGGILVDLPTKESGANSLGFKELPAVMLKGVAQPVRIFEPSFMKGIPVFSHVMVGREMELRKIERRFADFVRDSTFSGAIAIEGESGMGKTTMLAALNETTVAKMADAITFTSRADSYEKSTPYFVFRDIFEQVCFFNAPIPSGEVSRAEHLRARVREMLRDQESLLKHVSLLNDTVFGVLFETSSETEALDVDSRAALTRSILSTMLLHCNPKKRVDKLVIVIQNAHYVDEASWNFIESVIEQGRPVLFLITTRPGPKHPVFEGLCGRYDVLHIVLEGIMQNSELTKIACNRLHVSSIDETVCEELIRRSEGVPLFCVEMCEEAVNSGMLVINTDTGKAERPPEAPKQLAIPNRIQLIVSSRIDQLKPELSMLLKVASVFGNNFSTEDLVSLYKQDTAKRAVIPFVGDYLNELCECGFLVQKNSEARYSFKHTLYMEAAYEMLPFAERGLLHKSVAEFMEESGMSEHVRYLAFLIRQWEQVMSCSQNDDQETRTLCVQKQVHYLQKSAEHDIKQNVLTDAVSKLKRAVKLVRTLPVSESTDNQEMELLMVLQIPLLMVQGSASEEVHAVTKRTLILSKAADQQLSTFKARLRSILLKMHSFSVAHTISACTLLSKSTDDPMLRLEADAFAVMGHFFHGELSTCSYLAERVLTRWHALGRPPSVKLTVLEPISLIYSYGLAVPALHMGDLHQHDHYLSLTCASLTESGNEFQLAETLSFHALQLALVGHFNAAKALATKAFEVSSGKQFALPQQICSMVVAAVDFWQQADKREEIFVQMLGLQQTTTYIFYYPLLLHACLKLQNIAKCQELLEQWYKSASIQDEWVLFSEYHRCNGELLLLQADLGPDHDTAVGLRRQAIEEAFADAIACSEFDGSSLLLIRATHSLALLKARLGDPAGGARLLNGVADVYIQVTQGTDVLVVEEAMASCRQLTAEAKAQEKLARSRIHTPLSSRTPTMRLASRTPTLAIIPLHRLTDSPPLPKAAREDAVDEHPVAADVVLGRPSVWAVPWVSCLSVLRHLLCCCCGNPVHPGEEEYGEASELVPLHGRPAPVLVRQPSLTAWTTPPSTPERYKKHAGKLSPVLARAGKRLPTLPESGSGKAGAAAHTFGGPKLF